ncbi:homoprotocatechuate degradation operon regulator, HpaR [Delftia tsuruhatensis]|uniref:MarR family winged helix-turn-helix transcriptional regulator n=1 Tax=Delftia tsuruhatensis TaxID=180282 RepID=UPI001E7E69F4|nr:MarR family transcriptional regulator [Delftia tsuruhatensis]CAB5717014.1 homoprotocatechuate degradation operon regulator, HpaR [Delftia tsuruhatensis]CAC9683978.1 homoprotocatechuate degradation operon regulator, HpaR [Delftia tsuruhatensis]
MTSATPSSSPTSGNGPWTDLDESGSTLTVDLFLTTLMSQVGNALRRTITVPYADAAELTVSEWRLLALIAHAGELPFSALVVQSTSDKALVSRTLRLLEERGLVALRAEGHTPRKKILCAITPEGQRLHDQVMPQARRRQAAALRVLTPEEREVMYRALHKLRGHCQEGGSSGSGGED